MDHKKLEAYRKEYQGVEMSEKDYQLMLLRMQQAKLVVGKCRSVCDAFLKRRIW